jgi:hypothetical protein
LEDVPLLPDLFATSEKRATIEQIILLSCTLLKRQGLRPIGLNFDDLASTFLILASCLEAVYPEVVRFWSIEDLRSKTWVSGGGIVIDAHARCIMGFEAGQDALHVYHRLLAVLNTRSVEAAWSIRCLRKWLGSLNPASRFGNRDTDEIEAKCDVIGANSPAWPATSDAQAVTVSDVLGCYFQCKPFPANSFETLQKMVGEPWLHPVTRFELPCPAKALLLDDVGRAGSLKGKSRQYIAALSYRLVYGSRGHPTADSIRADLLGLAELFATQNFDGSKSAGNPAWYKAQMLYLKHVRVRPSGPRAGAAASSRRRSPRLARPPDSGACKGEAERDAWQEEEEEEEDDEDEEEEEEEEEEEKDGEAEEADAGNNEEAFPDSLLGRKPLAAVRAGGPAFDKAATQQSLPVNVNGLLASYRCKLWALSNGRSVSLGTIGIERHWRNLQRAARNKGRSRADTVTVNILNILRWVRSVAARMVAGRCKDAGRKQASRPDQERDAALVAEDLAASLLFGSRVAAPLAEAGMKPPMSVVTLDDVGYVYSLFAKGLL